MNLYAFVFNTPLNVNDDKGTNALRISPPMKSIGKKVVDKLVVPLYVRLLSDLATENEIRDINKKSTKERCSGAYEYPVWHKHVYRTQVRFGATAEPWLRVQTMNRSLIDQKIPTTVEEQTPWITIRKVLVRDWVCIRCDCYESLVLKETQNWRNTRKLDKEQLTLVDEINEISFDTSEIISSQIDPGIDLYREKRREEQHTVRNYECQ